MFRVHKFYLKNDLKRFKQAVGVRGSFLKGQKAPFLPKYCVNLTHFGNAFLCFFALKYQCLFDAMCSSKDFESNLTVCIVKTVLFVSRLQ